MVDAALSDIRAIVVDDEPLPRVHLAQLLKEAGVGTVVQATGATRCLEIFEDEDEPPDWAFLDVRMPGMDGLGLADALRTGQIGEPASFPKAAVVFVTGYEDYAVEAFDRAAADYLLKPVARDRLQITLKRLLARRSAQLASSATEPLAGLPAPSLSRLPIRMDYSVRLVDTEEIVAATAREKRVEVITQDASYRTYYTLSQLEQRLSSERFVRVHDSWIVNLGRILEIHSLGDQTYQLRLRGLDRLVPVSRRRLPVLRQRLGL